MVYIFISIYTLSQNVKQGEVQLKGKCKETSYILMYKYRYAYDNNTGIDKHVTASSIA